jgi:hypothetical protein
MTPNWISSDSGSLWISGRSKYDQGQWATTRPIQLAVGDVVAVSVHACGDLEVHCNGVWQVRWAAARVPTDQPLYAIVGMRAPAAGVALRCRETDLTRLPPGAHTVTLRGIEGRVGEVVDLSKHGRPRFPAAFHNTRAISDIRSLFPRILAPWERREHGRSGAQPILIRAGAGTGKTWCIGQLLYFLALGWRSLPISAKWPALSQGLPTRVRAAARGEGAHATRLELTPYAVYVQKLARLMRQQTARGGAPPTTDLVRFYMRREAAEGALDGDTLAVLEQSLEMRALVLLIDGVDEAADLKEIVEDYVCRELVPQARQPPLPSQPSSASPSAVLPRRATLSSSPRGRRAYGCGCTRANSW